MVTATAMANMMRAEMVETLARRGYRFVAPVERIAAGGSAGVAEVLAAGAESRVGDT
jgi:DNA-binding winged helix-turn-helix (wHTH) protein